jgi:hypothetical protein
MSFPDPTSLPHDDAPAASSLPVLQVNGGKGKAFQAYVVAYVVGTTRSPMTSGQWLRPLYYVSLIAAKGQGTTLQGLWATLVGQQSSRLWLSDVGQVALASQQASLAEQECSWHSTQRVLDNGHLHVVIEPSFTCYDPTLLPGSRRRSSKRQTPARQERKPPHGSRAESEPVWLFLVPRWLPPEEVALRHWSFLDARFPWPLWPECSDFLWQRGLRTGEIEPLTVWCASPTQAQAQAQAAIPPLLSAAYLCRPRSLALITELQQALAEGQLPLPQQDVNPLVPAAH